MKKLSKIRLQNAVVLEESEMKAIYGGSGGTNSDCSATCADGQTVEIEDCNGTCTSKDADSQSDGYAECVGETKTLKKSCGGSGGSGSY